jgi:nucleotide-binding universal stress UspA family protein
MTSQTSSVVLVGVDGSDGSAQAFDWAAGFAAQIGARVLAVAAWHFPAGYGFAPMMANVDFAGDASKMLEEMAGLVRQRFPDLHIDTEVVEGLPAQVLLERAHSVELLVVGSRGHGAFAGLLLGSVSQHCVTHAPVTVVVVRGIQG